MLLIQLNKLEQVSKRSERMETIFTLKAEKEVIDQLEHVIIVDI
jgi:hypothetical protein